MALLSASWYSRMYHSSITPDNFCPIVCTDSFSLLMVLLQTSSNRVESLYLAFMLTNAASRHIISSHGIGGIGRKLMNILVLTRLLFEMRNYMFFFLISSSALERWDCKLSISCFKQVCVCFCSINSFSCCSDMTGILSA